MTNTLNTQTGTIGFAPKKVIWIYVLFLSSLLIDFEALVLKDYVLNAVLMILTVGIGHSVGLHRGVIHKSYISTQLFRKVSIYLFVLTGMGSPLSWLKQHYFRDYWQNRNDCPTYFRYQHSLLTDYWWNLHLSYKPKEIGLYQIPKSDVNNTWLKHLNRYWLLHYVGFALLIFLAFGLNSMLFLICLRSSIIILGHWFIGYTSHKWGYARYTIKGADESGYNDVFLGFISFGEGFHNNHHSYPTSAKFSSRWYEIDFGWVLISICKKLGWITSVKTQENNLKATAIENTNCSWHISKT
ncbi:acyl-CoA desaturase [Rasiella rasia]|uniref:Acyl-CoA desaturase n=1 Tax=Rasiella rasia TaxID=2744027 RepID=A0A6G6GP86_9FLAO|nr:fatty acid desaturase [Rasiella rasia]QIE60347.1 acyl-CoA desaturase [Rasiella rasia]